MKNVSFMLLSVLIFTMLVVFSISYLPAQNAIQFLSPEFATVPATGFF